MSLGVVDEWGLWGPLGEKKCYGTLRHFAWTACKVPFAWDFWGEESKNKKI